MSNKKVDVEGFTNYVLDLLDSRTHIKQSDGSRNENYIPMSLLAEKVGVHVNTITNYRDKLRGTVRPPFATIFALAEELGMTREDILKKLYPEDLEDVSWILEHAAPAAKALRTALEGATKEDQEKVMSDLEYVAQKKR